MPEVFMTKDDLAVAQEEHFLRRQRELFGRVFPKGSIRTDANETPFLERQYVQLRTRIFSVEFMPTLARTFGPIATDIDPFTDVFSYAVEEIVGAAKIGSYAAKDVPRVDTNVKEVFGKVVPIVDAFGWNIGEMGQAARLNYDLSGRKMLAARGAIERGIDKVLAYGAIADETGTIPQLSNMSGLLNNADVTGLGITPLGWWLNPTPLSPSVVLADMSGLVSGINTTTGGLYTADTLLLPVAYYNYVKETPFSTLTGKSILQTFKDNNSEVTLIAPWWRLNTAGAGGVPRAVAYVRNAEVLELIIPLDFTTMPPEQQVFELIYNCHARCGGAKVYRPYAFKYGDFAQS